MSESNPSQNLRHIDCKPIMKLKTIFSNSKDAEAATKEIKQSKWLMKLRNRIKDRYNQYEKKTNDLLIKPKKQKNFLDDILLNTFHIDQPIRIIKRVRVKIRIQQKIEPSNTVDLNSIYKMITSSPSLSKMILNISLPSTDFETYYKHKNSEKKLKIDFNTNLFNSGKRKLKVAFHCLSFIIRTKRNIIQYGALINSCHYENSVTCLQEIIKLEDSNQNETEFNLDLDQER